MARGRIRRTAREVTRRGLRFTFRFTRRYHKSIGMWALRTAGVSYAKKLGQRKLKKMLKERFYGGRRGRLSQRYARKATRGRWGSSRRS